MNNLISPKNLELFRQKLTEREEKFRNQLQQRLTVSNRPSFKILADAIIENGTIDFAYYLNDEEYKPISYFLEELTSIRAALNRMDLDHYGRCLDCYGDIDVTRLSVYPTVTRCDDCEMRHNQMEKREASAYL
ncbi:TraR/DksA family transcriptional regulator [Pleionea sediminis]|uniref:TraR/DksA family transcriptional regulator n=1 Tax=Pleionea sediminis TaxID=2569479 RepID=UPI001186301A|nr:TraR/DksA C4-type zinc finger protein [Pleionea sediminis]